MGRRLETFRKSWCVWVVLFFSIGIKALVNQVEGPFARSLVVCDAYLLPDTYTGSRWCGSRLDVIQEGVWIQSVGQSQENLAMLCSLTFVVVLTGAWGAKAAVILGLVGVDVSVALFVAACSSPELGRSLYAMAQGLQGVYPIEYLQGVVMLHLSFIPELDGQMVFELGSYMGIASNLVWNVGLGNFVSLLELSDYTTIWSGILALNFVILVMALLCLPAMRPLDGEKTADCGPLGKLFYELASYKDLLLDWRARRLLFKLVFENLQSPYFTVSLPAQMMAYHGWSQPGLIWLFFFPQLLGMACIPLYQKLLDRFGHHATYVWSCRWLELTVLLKAITMPYTDKVMIFLVYSSELLNGFHPFRGFVDSRFAEPEQMQRFQSVQWVMGYFEGIWAVPAYADLFDAYADTYYGRALPGLLCAAALVIHYFLVFHTIYDMDGVHGFGVTVRLLDEVRPKGAQLWGLVAAEEGWIGWEKWQLYNLEEIMELPWEYVGGEGIFSYDHWRALMEALNATPRQGQETLKKLDAAIAYGQGVHEAIGKAQQEQVAKAITLWHMVAAEDGWISFEKWEGYQLEAILGLQWVWTGEQGVFSVEQWLGLFDPRQISKEDLEKLDYCISHADGVHKAIGQMAIDHAEPQAMEGWDGTAQAQSSWEEYAGEAEMPCSWERHAGEVEAQHAWEKHGGREALPSWDGHTGRAEAPPSWGEHTGWAEAPHAWDEGWAVAPPSWDGQAGGKEAAGNALWPTAPVEATAVAEATAAAEAIAAGAADPAAEGKKDA